MSRRKSFRKPLISLAATFMLVLYIIWGNTSITVSEINVTSAKLPKEFSGFRIAQISDLHNAEFGAGNERLLRLVAESQPDIIVLTGDLFDSRHTDVEVSIALGRDAAAIAPTYYVTGNHEARLPDEYQQLKAGLQEAGVTVLENELVTLTRGSAAVSLLGIHDPNFTHVESALVDLTDGLEGYTILLAHHPELVGYYAGAGINLVFSGHAHGGQFRFPLIGGLIAPGQGLFPTYDAGLYVVDDTQMVVSRGLGNSAFPFRLNNRPELVVVELTDGA